MQGDTEVQFVAVTHYFYTCVDFVLIKVFLFELILEMFRSYGCQASPLVGQSVRLIGDWLSSKQNYRPPVCVWEVCVCVCEGYLVEISGGPPRSVYYIWSWISSVV